MTVAAEKYEVLILVALAQGEFFLRSWSRVARCGYVAHLSDDANGIALAAELIAAERECCPFLTFQLIIGPNKGPVTLRMTGPVGAKDFVRRIFCEDRVVRTAF